MESKVLDLIHEVWQHHPTMRFFQLLDWLEHEYSSRNNSFGKREGVEILAKGDKQPFSFIDLYYLDDEHFEEFLLQIVSEQR
ncbi:hypothetical protein [Terribacillus halophilus]|uniref:hypothetical protein n=1 Tax=Terribacillus halophilus TaxID=361279 RepID=UPI000985AC1E|nr:hypothetical protein [Terribacillus halophilus]